MIASPDVDETPIRGEKPSAMVRRLAHEKAIVISRQSDEKGPLLILAADTTVVDPKGRILGKPIDRTDAIRMLTALQGKTHRVFTGYAILQVVGGRVKKRISRVVETRVKIRKMSSFDVEAYVDQGESADKAGAYAAQGFGMVLIEKIEGSYTNVVGLPMTQVIRDLRAAGWKR